MSHETRAQENRDGAPRHWRTLAQIGMCDEFGGGQ
jgi:hypothetical protein